MLKDRFFSKVKHFRTKPLILIRRQDKKSTYLIILNCDCSNSVFRCVKAEIDNPFFNITQNIIFAVMFKKKVHCAFRVIMWINLRYCNF